MITFVTYGSRHASAMPVTLSKVMEDWGMGYLVKYDDIDGLKKFMKSNYLQWKSP